VKLIDLLNSQNYLYKATPLHAVDGDTVDFMIHVDCGFRIYVDHKIRVRLRDIDTPEMFGRASAAEKAHGRAARAEALELLGLISATGKPIAVQPVDVVIQTFRDRTGKYGRYIARVELPDGRFLSGALEEAGMKKKDQY